MLSCPLAADIFCCTPSVLIAFIFSLFVVLGWNSGLGCQSGNCATIGLYPSPILAVHGTGQLSWHLRVSDRTRRRLCSEERMGVLHTHCRNSEAETGVRNHSGLSRVPQQAFCHHSHFHWSPHRACTRGLITVPSAGQLPQNSSLWVSSALSSRGTSL